jgi:hypothetical protein
MGYGPDILHLVDDGALKDIGVTPGDIIRLKQNSLLWWNSTSAKHKCDDRTPSPVCSTMPPSKRISFEKWFHDGGSMRLFGPKMVEGDLPMDADCDWFYYVKREVLWCLFLPVMYPLWRVKMKLTKW